MNPLISVIIPAYNNENDLKISINSILAQTYTNYEIIVIDDGSTDRTPDICMRYGRKIKYLRINHIGNPGLVRNIGIKASMGSLIAYQDADDMSHPTRFEKQVKALENADMVYTGMSSYTGKGISNDDYFFTEYEYNKLLKHCFIPAGSVMHKRSLFDSIGYWNERLDGDLWMRIAEKHKIVGIPNTLYFYQIHESTGKKRGIVANKLIDINIYKEAYKRTHNKTVYKYLLLYQFEHWLYSHLQNKRICNLLENGFNKIT